MAPEDQEILTKISQLAGQINRHKNGDLGNQQTALRLTTNTQRGSKDRSTQLDKSLTNDASGFHQASTEWRPSRGAFSSRPYSRGGRSLQAHRNRTLVLNGAASKTVDGDPSPGGTPPADSSENAKPAWVTKTDRHLQLINASIYEKDSQNRTKAIEETRKQKLRQRDEREKTKFTKHLQRLAANGSAATAESARTQNASGNYEINVQGIRFVVAKNGSKLIKVAGEDYHETSLAQLPSDLRSSRQSGDTNAAKATPKIAVVGGVRFYRSKNGNMYRSGIIKAHRREGVVKRVNELCKTFNTTGSCSKGPSCRYIHDPLKVALCKAFIHKGSCPSGDSCDLSHDPTPERTPNCVHFSKGNCSNPQCRYSHVHVSPTALVCRQFGVYGYCEKGASCSERHVHECPDFSNTGVCTTKGCKLPHRHKASIMRSNVAARGESSTEDERSDVSSDEEEEEIDSDDVDSDDLDGEFFGDDGKPDSDIPMQRDFVQLS